MLLPKGACFTAVTACSSYKQAGFRQKKKRAYLVRNMPHDKQSNTACIKKIEFLFITLSFMQKNLSVLAIQSVYDASMPHPCEDVVRGEILPSAWILEPDVVNGRDITRVIYMAQVRLFITVHHVQQQSN